MPLERLLPTRRRRPPARSGPGSPAVTPADAGVAAAELRMPEAFAALAAPPVFITGVGRSGKTMVFDAFASHPEVCPIFESWLLTTQSGLTGLFHQPQWHPGFYARQRERIGHEHAAVALVSYAEAAGDLGELLAGWMMRRLEPGQRFLVEKTPVDVVALSALFPSARLIHVIRDGRDVVGSIARAAASWAPEMGADGEDVGTWAERWRARVEALRQGEALLGDRYVEARFEDARADLGAVLRELFAFAGIPYDEETVARGERATAPDAYEPGARASGFRGAGQVGGWQSRMTRAEGRTFDAAAGALLVDLGYAADRGWWRELPRRRSTGARGPR